MIQSIAIQAYFNRMRHFFTRQGFDTSTKVVYGADAEGPQKLLDQDMADKPMDRKQQSDRDTIRSLPYTYLFWTRDSLQNIVRRPFKVRDGSAGGKDRYKKTVSASFGMGCVFVSNKANAIEDFSEAMASEYQNMHTVPINLKFAYDDRRPVSEGGFDTVGLNMTVINELGTEENVSFRQGNVFSYSWNVELFLNFVSEFADIRLTPLKQVFVDLYNERGVPLSSMDFEANAMWRMHTATDGTRIFVPARPLTKNRVVLDGQPVPLTAHEIITRDGCTVTDENGTDMYTEGT